MSAERRRAKEFERSYWRDYADLVARCERACAQDPDPVLKALERAWEIRDSKQFVAMAEALDRAGALCVDDRQNAAVTLIQHERPRQALELLSREMMAGGPAKRLVVRARALAAAGRFVEAQGVADDALQQRHGYAPALELMRSIARLQRLQAMAETTSDWLYWRSLIESCLGLKARSQARAFAERALSLPLPAKLNRVKEMVVVFDAALDLGVDPLEVRHFVRAALDCFPSSGELRAIEIQCVILEGAPEAAPLSAPSRPQVNPAFRYAAALALETVGKTAAAAEALGRLTVELPHDQDIRSSLAHCVGKDVLKRTRVRLQRGRARRVFNVFPFSDELGLLKIRLHEMAGWVDHFVLVEAAETFAGAPKPLHYQENKGLFAEFASKIIHLPLEGFPAHIGSHWARDFYQRDMAITAVADLLGEDDLVFITDVDEIVDHEAVKDFDGDFARLQMGLYRFFLNYRPAAHSKLRSGRTGAVWKAKLLARWGLSYARFTLSRLEKDWCRIEDAGWHFTSIGDADRIARKYSNYAHQELQTQLRDAATTSTLLQQLRAGELEADWERCDIDESFPRYIREHQAELSDLIL